MLQKRLYIKDLKLTASPNPGSVIFTVIRSSLRVATALYETVKNITNPPYLALHHKCRTRGTHSELPVSRFISAVSDKDTSQQRAKAELITNHRLLLSFLMFELRCYLNAYH